MTSAPFLGISCFGGSEVFRKYAVWVLVGCVIEIRIQWVFTLEIRVKKEGDTLKIQTNFFFFYDKYVKSTIMVESFY